MQVNVDRPKCIGCGACVALCPEVFELNELGKALVKDAEACEHCDCNSAAQNCPVGAITVVDDEHETTELEEATADEDEPILEESIDKEYE